MGTLTLNGLLPVIYNAMEVISREQIGMIPAVSRDSGAERAAINETVRSPSVGPMVAEDLTPGAVAADTPNQTINYVDMTIQKARSVPFGITGEEARGLNNGGTLGNINAQRITQALRTLSNEIESDLTALHVNASRAYGTFNVTPFGTAADFTDFSNSLRILDDNGAPITDRQMVLGSSAISNIRGKQSGLFKANEANSDELLRRGIIGQVEGWDIHNSGQIKSQALAGSAAGSTTNTAGYPIGATVINLASAGTGAFFAGDIVAIAGDADNKYVLAAGDADTSNGGTIVLAEPGLRKAIPGAATAITVIAATTRNMFFHRSAIQLATRAPAMPEEGDSADDVMMVTDPVSGITYEFCIYKQKRQVRYEVNLAWGVKAVAPRHIGLLIGA